MTCGAQGLGQKVRHHPLALGEQAIAGQHGINAKRWRGKVLQDGACSVPLARASSTIKSGCVVNAHALLGGQGQGIAIVGLQHIGRGHRMRLAIDLEQQGPVMGPPGVTQAAVVQQIIGVLRGAVLGQIPRRGDQTAALG